MTRSEWELVKNDMKSILSQSDSQKISLAMDYTRVYKLINCVSQTEKTDGVVELLDLHKEFTELLAIDLREACQRVVLQQFSHSLLAQYVNEWLRYSHACNCIDIIMRPMNVFLENMRAIEFHPSKGSDYALPGETEKIIGFCRNMDPSTTLGKSLWKERIFMEIKEKHYNKLVVAALDLIEQDRSGNFVPREIIRSFVASMVEMNSPSEVPLKVYHDHFEIPLIASTKTFYERKSSLLMCSSDLVTYMDNVRQLLSLEATRIRATCEKDTYSPVMAACETELIRAHAETIQSQFLSYLSSWTTHALALSFGLLKVVDGLYPVLGIFESFVFHCVSDEIDKRSLLSNKDPKYLTESLVNNHRRFFQLTETTFNHHPQFTAAVDKAFKRLCNDRTEGKLAEILAKYCDILLKKSVKNENVTDQDVEVKLSGVITIFQYIENKDVFQKFYSRLLAKRYIQCNSASKEAECHMINQLKALCGHDFTTRLQRMTTDLDVSDDLNKEYSHYIHRSHITQQFDSSFLILTACSWPLTQSSATPLLLPDEIELTKSNFLEFYNQKYAGRKLSWLHQFSRGELKAMYLKKRYEFQVSAYQMAILLLFNLSIDTLTLKELIFRTELSQIEISRIVKSLVDSRVLIQEGLSISLNMEFISKRIKNRIATIGSQESAEENTETLQNLDEERKLFLQAIIVRIMKSRRRLSHNELIIETTKQAQSRFLPNVLMIKKVIDHLIEQQYLERDSSSLETYAYVV